MENNWNKLLQQAQEGNKESYKLFLTQVQSFVKSIVYSKVQNNAIIEDISQEVLIAIHNSLHTYDASRNAKSWISVITRNKTVDYLRSKQYRQDNSYSLDEIEEPIAENHKIEDKHDLNNAMKNISAKQQVIIKKMKIEGKTAKQTATEVGMSESAVKVSAHRAYKLLKEFLEV